jgi:amidohydrolase
MCDVAQGWKARGVTADTRDPLQARIHQEIAGRAGALWEVARALHREPETAFGEKRAAALLTAELAAAGFDVEAGLAGMPTAFRARTGSGTRTGTGPQAALLLEYDALPEIGHACGHNLIAAAGLGAALALRAALPDMEGTLSVVGTPAEESGGGKVIAVEAGLFDGVDAALMFHPGVYDWARAPLTASAQVRVGFAGRAAHPTGNPTEGIDALAALIEFFNTLTGLGRRLPSGSHVQGIVTNGGKATNVVPDYAEGLFGLRGATTTARRELEALLATCADGIAQATGTTAEIAPVGTGYEHFRDNGELSARFAGYLGPSGIRLGDPVPGVYLGSSDIGNVSHRVPAIHPFVSIMDGGSDHTPEFAAAAAAPRGRTVMLAAAEALARTAADVLLEPSVRDAAWQRFRESAAAGL